MGKLSRETVSGVKWLVGASFLQKALSVGTMIILARILNPSIFGLFALAFVAIDALSLFKSMGFDSALIQRQDNVEKAANTAFFIIPALGTTLFIALYFLAPMISRFLNSSEVVNLIRALGIIFVFSCFAKVPQVLLTKYMRFNKTAITEIVAALIYSLTAIILAFLGYGVWSLVIGYILKTAVQMTLFWVFAAWRPKWEFDPKIARELFHFGKFLFLGGVIWFLKSNLDNLLVGKLLGVTSLGLYALAFNIANFGSMYFGSKVYQVIFPAYSKIQNDLDDLKSAFLRTLKYMSIFAFPLCLGLFLLGGEFLRFIYGEKWIGATPVLKILAWAGLFNTLPISAGAAFLALGRPKIGFCLGLLQVSLFFILITPAAKLFGINGVASVVASSSFIAMVVAFFWIKKLLNLSIKQIYGSLKPALGASLAMALVIIFFKNIAAYTTNQASIYHFITNFIFSASGYILTLTWMERTILREIKGLIFS